MIGVPKFWTSTVRLGIGMINSYLQLCNCERSMNVEWVWEDGVPVVGGNG